MRLALKVAAGVLLAWFLIHFGLLLALTGLAGSVGAAGYFHAHPQAAGPIIVFVILLLLAFRRRARAGR